MLASAPESREELTSGTSYSPPPAFGRFKLLHQIGAGVLGPVFRTHDPDRERLAAVKAFTLDVTPEQASALASEFERLAGLDLDAASLTAPVAAGVEDFVPWVAVPYVPGESLDAAIRQYGPAPAGDAIRLIGHVAEALDAAAHLGVFHGSLHPRDIIVTPGETHVTGFGVAQALERIGLHGPVRRPYVAPEREGGDAWGAAADIYSLAAIAYEVLTGRRALPGTDQPLPALNDVRVHDAAALREAIETALDPDPDRRPAHARDFAAAFASALSEAAAPGAIGDGPAERRPRKVRVKAPKLPGLDEPLQAPEGAAKGRPKSVAPVVPVAEVPGVAESQVVASEPAAERTGGGIPAEPVTPAGDIRYVPVTDPADAGEAPTDLGDLAVSLAQTGPGVQGDPTPDLRLVDDVPPPGSSPGETVDAELAAALDHLGSDRGAFPTPTPFGIDIFGPDPAATTVPVEFAGATAPEDLAAETPLAYRFEDHPDAPAPRADSTETAAERQTGDGLLLDFTALEGPQASADGRTGQPIELGGFDAPTPAGGFGRPLPEGPSEGVSATGADAPRPFVRGRGAERRRTPSRYGRTDSTPEAISGGSVEEEGGVPRAFEPARPAPPPVPVPDFELLTRAAPGRLPLVPVLLGAVAGLILGLAGGYWLGTRNAPQAGVTAAGVVTSGRPDPAQPASTAGQPPPAAAAPQATVPQPPAQAAGPTDATAVPPSPERAAPAAPAETARGAIQVTSSHQANVYLDGELRGMTPRNLRNVPLGSHTVRVTRPGYAPQEQTLVLTPEEPSARLAFTLRRGSAPPAAGGAPAARSVLTVLIESVPPGARIRIDGRDLGPAPLTVRQMRPGTHTLELRLPGYRPWSQRITVAAGDRRQITATLERDNSR